MKKKNFSVLEGLLSRNAVLSEGMVIAPIVVCCDTLYKALMLCLAFSCLTFFTVLICSLYPKNTVYAVKVVRCALTASILYLPVSMLCNWVQPELAASLGIYLPLLTFNSFIVLHTQLHFFTVKKVRMVPMLLLHILGFCLTAVLIGRVRELLAYGTLCDRVVAMPLVMRGLRAPWAGFILLGVCCALHRKLFPREQRGGEGI